MSEAEKILAKNINKKGHIKTTKNQLYYFFQVNSKSNEIGNNIFLLKWLVTKLKAYDVIILL